jgi:hypothetical protein
MCRLKCLRDQSTEEMRSYFIYVNLYKEGEKEEREKTVKIWRVWNRVGKERERKENTKILTYYQESSLSSSQAWEGEFCSGQHITVV